MPGLITNVFGQRPVPSRRFRFGLTWRGDFARERILRFFMIAVSDLERYFNHFEQQNRHVSHSNVQVKVLKRVNRSHWWLAATVRGS